MKIANNTDYNNICKKEEAIQKMVDELEAINRVFPVDERFISFTIIAEKVLDRIYQAKLEYDKNRLNQ